MELAHSNQASEMELFWRTHWDFFSGGSGSKSGYIMDLKENGCILKTSEPIEFRRWIRMLIQDNKTNVSFTAIGRVVRCENAFEASVGNEVTLYRYKVEFTYPIDAARLKHLGPESGSESSSEFSPLYRPRSVSGSWAQPDGNSAPTSA